MWQELGHRQPRSSQLQHLLLDASAFPAPQPAHGKSTGRSPGTRCFLQNKGKHSSQRGCEATLFASFMPGPNPKTSQCRGWQTWGRVVGPVGRQAQIMRHTEGCGQPPALGTRMQPAGETHSRQPAVARPRGAAGGTEIGKGKLRPLLSPLPSCPPPPPPPPPHPPASIQPSAAATTARPGPGPQGQLCPVELRVVRRGMGVGRGDTGEREGGRCCQEKLHWRWI